MSRWGSGGIDLGPKADCCEGLGNVVGNGELWKSLKGGVAQPGLVSAVPFRGAPKEGLSGYEGESQQRSPCKV